MTIGEPWGADQIDVSPVGKDIDLLYNLQTRTFTGDVSSSPSSGTDPWGVVWFNVNSNPFQYLCDLDTQVTFDGSMYHYEYTLLNMSDSTFDIDSWSYCDIGYLLEPGKEFKYDFWSALPPMSVSSSIVYDDLDKTTLSKMIQVPVPAPGAFILGSIGVGLVWLRRRRTL